MKKLIIKILISAIILLIPHGIFAVKENFKTLEKLNVQDPLLKSIRKQIRKSIRVTKSGMNPEQLPELKFTKYRVKKNDTFWKIISKTSQNIDTLSTVNSLSTPEDIVPGRIIYIPNMRGVIYDVKRNESLAEISRNFKVDSKYICQVNKIDGAIKKHIFIPCGQLSNTERSLFLGIGFVKPLKLGYKSSKFGIRKDPINKKMRFHNGLDIACPMGSKVYAARSGKITFTGYKGGYGKLVIVKHSHGYLSYYGHLSKIKKKKGDSIKRGELIALSGNTGRTTGPHLHFEIRKKKRPVNPEKLLRN